MKDDVRKYIYGTLIVFVVGVLAWVSVVYVSSCGFTLTCTKGALTVERTPIPTLQPASMPAMSRVGGAAPSAESCRVAAIELIGAWVNAGSPETDAFQFADVNGVECQATYAEVQPLFNEPNLWSSASLACISCHSGDVKIIPAQLDVSSYAGITAGSRRPDAESKGTDILGGGNWEKSLLYDFIVNVKADVPGHNTPILNSLVSAGAPLSDAPVATPTP